jgi:hypothetical protein
MVVVELQEHLVLLVRLGYQEMMLLTQVDGIMLLEVVLQVLVILVRIVPQFLQ